MDDIGIDGCGKRSYETPEQGNYVLNRILGHLQREQRRGGTASDKKAPVRVYGPCEEGFYHLTSQPAEPEREFDNDPQFAVEVVVRRRERDMCARCGDGAASSSVMSRKSNCKSPDHVATKPHLRASNRVLMCHDCSIVIRDGAEGMTEGWWLVWTIEPTKVPVLYRGSWVLLDDLGGRTVVDPSTLPSPY